MRLFVFGIGYTARAFIASQTARWSRVSGTVRSADKATSLQAQGIRAYPLAQDRDGEDLASDIRLADAILVSAPPGPDGDPILRRFGDAIASGAKAAWIGYLSTTGVYGDRGGAWVDETVPVAPASRQSVQRAAAERDWLAFGKDAGRAAHVFRLTGIYGPGRNALANLAQGTAKRVIRQGQVFNRIHVDDIARILASSLERPRGGAIYNVADDEPAPPQDVIAYAARLARVAAPPEIPIERAELSPMSRSFYGENKRICNRLVKDELQVRLLYPTYREGLDALYAAGEFARAP